MRMTNILATAAAVAALSTTAFAGGLSPEVMEAPVVAVEPAPAGSSINPAFIVVGVLAALLIAASLDDDDDEESNG
ncbi:MULTISPECIES: hypothetical protein [unclassified Yoonia]|uniref:hypothetical protein n=1 Tax=unclassified Yoonia TaxID=2629118 RepID=UPI002AFE6C60|nr:MULTISPECIES: hypothetical protein [unclassified Yoonia]